jgi:hypothetical protein
MKKLGKILFWTAITLVVLSRSEYVSPLDGDRSLALGHVPSLRASSSARPSGWNGAGICSLRQRDAPDATPCTTGVSMAGRCRRVAKASVR